MATVIQTHRAHRARDNEAFATNLRLLDDELHLLRTTVQPFPYGVERRQVISSERGEPRIQW